jgi:hypothetical protein
MEMMERIRHQVEVRPGLRRAADSEDASQGRG